MPGKEERGINLNFNFDLNRSWWYSFRKGTFFEGEGRCSHNDLQDFSFSTRDWTWGHGSKSASPNHWTDKEFPGMFKENWAWRLRNYKVIQSFNLAMFTQGWPCWRSYKRRDLKILTGDYNKIARILLNYHLVMFTNFDKPTNQYREYFQLAFWVNLCISKTQSRIINIRSKSSITTETDGKKKSSANRCEEHVDPFFW